MMAGTMKGPAPFKIVVNVQKMNRDDNTDKAASLATLDCGHTFTGTWKVLLKRMRRRCGKCLAGKKPDVRSTRR